jgi:signal transduction histidine kinase
VRVRLIASYLTITVITLLALVYPLGRTFASRERDRLLREIEQDATVVAGLSEDALEEGIPPDIDQVLRGYREDPGGRIVVVDASGRTVADSDRPGTTGVDFTNRPEIVTALGGATAEGSRRSETLGADLVYVAVPVASGGQVHGAVRITYPSSTLDDRIEAAWVGLAAASAAVILAVTAVGFALARLVTRPVDRLKDAAEAIAGGDLSARAPTDTGAPELRELATTFNATAARLQEVIDAQQAFVGDASHQLRTPLAALRLQLENIESTAPAEMQPALASALAETARLARISEGLLVLTRSAASAAAPVVIDAAAVARDRQLAWEPVAAEVGVMLEFDHPGPVAAQVDPGALEQILDNLVDNALVVAPPGSTVRLSIQPGVTAATIEVHVVDQGPGLTAEQRARALDRFWRGPAAEPGGTGLGLAIVAQLAGRCGGRAELREADAGGVDAVVTLLAAEFDRDAGTFTSR